MVRLWLRDVLWEGERWGADRVGWWWWCWVGVVSAGAAAGAVLEEELE